MYFDFFMIECSHKSIKKADFLLPSKTKQKINELYI